MKSNTLKSELILGARINKLLRTKWHFALKGRFRSHDCYLKLDNNSVYKLLVGGFLMKVESEKEMELLEEFEYNEVSSSFRSLVIGAAVLDFMVSDSFESIGLKLDTGVIITMFGWENYFGWWGFDHIELKRLGLVVEPFKGNESVYK